MFQAYRYGLEYSGRRERGKFAIQICLWHRSTTEKRVCGKTESSRMRYLTITCCIPLSFPLRLYYFLTRTG